MKFKHQVVRVVNKAKKQSFNLVRNGRVTYEVHEKGAIVNTINHDTVRLAKALLGSHTRN